MGGLIFFIARKVGRLNIIYVQNTNYLQCIASTRLPGAVRDGTKLGAQTLEGSFLTMSVLRLFMPLHFL